MDATPNREAEFLATVTAGATHELRNVLAVVKESAGLVADLIEFARPPAAPNSEKLLRAVGRIDAQVARGASIVTALSGLSRNLDGSGDLAQIVGQVVVLSDRRARRLRRSVEAASCADPVTVTVNVHALHLQMALFLALDRCLELVPEGGAVVVRADRTAGRPSVQFSSSGTDVRAAVSTRHTVQGDPLHELLRDLGGTVETSAGGAGFAVVLEGRGAA